MVAYEGWEVGKIVSKIFQPDGFLPEKVQYSKISAKSAGFFRDQRVRIL
jgi:hypothetical protein